MGDYNVSSQLIEEQRRKLQEKNNKGTYRPRVEFNEKNYLNLRLNKGEVKRDVKVRILPVSATDPNIFLIINTHSLKVNPKISQSGFKSFICLNDEHLEQHSASGCPLCNKSKQMVEEANRCENEAERKALFKAAMQYKSKQTFIVRVIERGHEDEGVKFWRFNAHSDGNGIYDQLMSLYDIRNQESMDAKGEPYNIFDLKNGKDIVITLTQDANSDKKNKVSIKIADAGFSTPLSKDGYQAESWINDGKVWSDMYASKTSEYLQIIADGDIPYYDKDNKKWIAKSEDSEDEKKNAEAEEKAKQALVEETQVSNEQDEGDDLPF